MFMRSVVNQRQTYRKEKKLYPKLCKSKIRKLVEWIRLTKKESKTSNSVR